MTMTQSSEGTQVSVIGLGNMGSALAEALLAKGHGVTVWNRTASKCEALAAAGARVAGSVAEAAAADVVVVCVTNNDAGTAVLQTDEVAAALRGGLLVQLSTVTAEESRELGRWAEAHGIAYLDGSILAYPVGIRDNEGTIVYSGPKSVFDANEAVLASLGGDPKLVGEAIGGAPTFDKTLYAVHYASMLAFFHGAAMCHAAGFPIETYTEQAAPMGQQMRLRAGETIAKRSYGNPGCALEVEAAAYAHVVRLSEELGVDTAFPKMVAGYFGRAIADGHGQHDLAATFEVLLKRDDRVPNAAE
jgi:3-hydroxyisobutyrate dehydrogenase-like beta-hydroxyacid dehydrogenase